MTKQQGEPPQTHPPQPAPAPTDGGDSGRAAYNVVSDTVTGLNVRMSDNLLQAGMIAASVVIFAVVGAVVVALKSDAEIPWYAGAFGGAVAGLVIGLVGSGVFLMIYRAVRHLQGKHD